MIMARWLDKSGNAQPLRQDRRRSYARGVRIVSLLPSATEIVYALGLDDHLVGVTFECDEPPTARRDKTVVVGGRDTSAMTPAEIDTYVRGRLGAGAPATMVG